VGLIPTLILFSILLIENILLNDPFKEDRVARAILNMDLQTLLIGLVIFIVSALLIYFITMVTMREIPYKEMF